MKKSAVEWLFKELLVLDKKMSIEQILAKAKEMEKQQIIEAGNTCASLLHIHIDKVNKMSLEELEKYYEEDVITCGEQYYNENYNKDL
jgi:glucose-6-phosphate isomerase